VVCQRSASLQLSDFLGNFCAIGSNGFANVPLTKSRWRVYSLLVEAISVTNCGSRVGRFDNGDEVISVSSAGF